MLLPDDWLSRNLTEIACLSPVEEIHLELFTEKGIHVFLKRDDLLHPQIGGNKIYKLYGHLREYAQSKAGLPILSFGGAYSNHLFALAAAGNMLDIPTIGVIRGERPEQESPTLQDMRSLGMQLHYVSREDYRQRDNAQFLNGLKDKFGEFYHVPEGGGGVTGAEGCKALAQGIALSLDFKPNYIFHACGTGASLAGLIAGIKQMPVGGIYTYGVSVLKGHTGLKDDVKNNLKLMGVDSQEWCVTHDYHAGGYAKFPPELALFMQEFEESTQVKLDPVYTVKVMSAIVDLVSKNTFAKGSHIVMVHSGGIQGRRGFGLAC